MQVFSAMYTNTAMYLLKFWLIETPVRLVFKKEFKYFGLSAQRKVFPPPLSPS